MTHPLSLERWRKLWRSLGAEADVALFEALRTHYGEPHRHYHTAAHLAECLAHFDSARALAAKPAEVELALWFHDAIYRPRRADNETKSAEWARTSVLARGLPEAMSERVAALVLATQHAAKPADADAQLLVDIDLAILGAPPERFSEYEQQIRKEYAWVPGPLYRRERRKALELFAQWPTLYSTEHFRSRLEETARTNLSRALGELQN